MSHLTTDFLSLKAFHLCSLPTGLVSLSGFPHPVSLTDRPSLTDQQPCHFHLMHPTCEFSNWSLTGFPLVPFPYLPAAFPFHLVHSFGKLRLLCPNCNRKDFCLCFPLSHHSTSCGVPLVDFAFYRLVSFHLVAFPTGFPLPTHFPLPTGSLSIST